MTNYDPRIEAHPFAKDARAFIDLAAEARGDGAYDVADAAEELANEAVAFIAAELGIDHRTTLEALLPGWGVNA